jgi:hypothetical protein
MLNFENTFYKNTLTEIGLGLQIERIREDVFFFKTLDNRGRSSILAYDKKFN